MNKERRNGAFLAYLNIILKNLVILVYTPFLLKYLGQAEYGLYQMANSVIMSLGLLSMGFSSAYVRFYIRYKTAEDEKGIKSLNGMYLLLFIFIGIVALLIGTILVVNIESIFKKTFTSEQLETTKILMGIMVLNIALTFPSSVFDSNIMVHERFLFQQSRQIIQTMLLPILTIPLIIIGYKSIVLVVVQTFITLIFLLLNMRFAIRKLNMQFNFRNLPLYVLTEIAVFSFFIFLNQVIDLINNNVPSFIVGIYSGPEDVATYSVAMQLKALFFMLSVSLSNIFIPYVNKLVSEGASAETLTKLMIKVGRIQLIVLTFILGGFITVGKYFINIWAGGENVTAYYLVILMILPVLVPLSQNVGIEIQRAMNKHYFRSLFYLIFAVVNIIVTVIGVKSFGLVGSIIGYVISIVFANGIAMNWYYYKKMSLNIKLFWMKMTKIILVFFVSVILLQVLQMYIPINNLLSFVLYGILYIFIYVLCYVFWIVEPDELQKIKKIIKKQR
ncbi:lipopolysaccharide biosynthesis protein [Enterococcus sp.]|uniref:lipopolysaccharide biosynthesis protein n=1 Tax=Enterococcus sp. TaxID=35783 RepID=UPI002FCB9BFA